MRTVNKERIAKWVAWLRDPAHTQARNSLRVDGSFCCLGGACEVFREETGEGNWKAQSKIHDPMGSYGFSLPNGTVTSYLPTRVAEWFGLYDEDPDIEPSLSAANANDNEGYSFREIADAIELRYLQGGTE